MAQFAGNAHWAKPSQRFAHRARPTPLKCKNEYLMHALGQKTAVQAMAVSIVWEFRRLKGQGVGSWAPAATRFKAFVPNFPFFSKIFFRSILRLHSYMNEYEIWQWFRKCEASETNYAGFSIFRVSPNDLVQNPDSVASRSLDFGGEMSLLGPRLWQATASPLEFREPNIQPATYIQAFSAFALVNLCNEDNEWRLACVHG